MANQPGLIDRLIFWVFGGTLFLSIGLLPHVLFSRYMETWAVHRITYLSVTIVLAVFWGVHKLRTSTK